MTSDDLETLLIQSHFLTPAQVGQAKAEAAKQNRRLAPTIIEMGMVNERRFAEWMSQMTSIPIVERIPPAVVEPLVARIPVEVAREYEVLPLGIERGTLSVAMMDPLDAACREALRQTTTLSIRPLIALHSSIMNLLARFYSDQSPLEPGDESLGSRTRAVAPEVKPMSQLDRLEQSIDELRTMISRLQERIDAIDKSLEHILSRR
jgi:type II secretion system (T2SS) protein E